GGGGGGSSGGGDDTTTTIEEEPKETGEDICREKWTCTDWSYCIDGRQTRTCTEQNDCGTDLYKPFEEQPCVTEEGKQAVGLDFGATGRFLASPVGIGSIVAILAVILGLFYWKKKGLKLKKTKSEK
ncbi:MAG: hypothetical protein KAT37_04560, partial [Candidatus Aenigmarchaeota archaeon]|nr:hypothetical protein [Candidatus Aenigmarchaeota archaeon]